MLHHNASPTPETGGPQFDVQQAITDGFDQLNHAETQTTSSLDSIFHQVKRKKNLAWLAASVVFAGILLGGMFFPIGAVESQHPNWRHVEAATDASKENASQLLHLTNLGSERIRAAVQVTSADADHVATRRVRTALRRGDLPSATAELQNAQRFSTVDDASRSLPNLASNPELAAELEQGRKRLFHIELFDCCQEDGDVVDLTVNGSHFATVPITNAGTMISVPLSTGNNTIAIQGTRDGRGGVTLSLTTSRGDFFTRRMRVGEVYEMGVVVQ